MRILKRWAVLLIVALLIVCGTEGARAQTNFSLSATGVTLGGNWAVDDIAGHLSEACYGGVGVIDLLATGTNCTLLNYFTSGQFVVTVRNADTGVIETGPTTTSVTLGSWQTNLSLFTLPSGRHWVSLTSVGNLHIDRSASSAFSVTGAAPTITFPVGFSTPVLLTTAGVTPHLLVSGYTAQTFNGYLQFQAYPQDSEIWFYATMTDFAVRTSYSDGQHYRLLNVDTGAAYTANDTNATTPGYIFLSHALDGTRHLYKLTTSGPSGSIIDNFMCSGGAGLDLSVTIAAKPVITVFGDSITQATVGTTFQSWQGYGHLLADYKSYAIANLGQNGTWVNAAGGGANSGENAVRTNAVIAANPTLCFILFGTNDLNGGATLANFQASFKVMCDALRVGCAPGCKFYVMGILPNNFAGKTQAQIDVFNGAMNTVVGQEVAAGGTWVYVDTKSWAMGGVPYQNGTGALDTTLFTDGLHPSAAGYSFMLSHLTPLFTQQAVFLNRLLHSRGRRNDGRAGGTRN